MIKGKHYLIILIALLISSCSFVGSEKPLGNKAYILKSEEWNGLWRNVKTPDQFFFIKVDNRKKNLIRIIAVNAEKNDWETVNMKASFFTDDKLLFLNILKSEFDEKDKKESGKKETKDVFLWFLVKKSKNKIEVFLPVENLFKEAINSGKLKGKIKNDLILIESSSDEIVSFIKKTGIFKAFDKDNALELKRILRFKSN